MLYETNLGEYNGFWRRYITPRITRIEDFVYRP
jgi:hypothetical protein